MSPRITRQDAAGDAVRARVLTAARALLLEPDALAALSIDTIAARAGVARSIMMQRRWSAAAVLEALYDELWVSGLGEALPRAFERSDPLALLDELMRVMARHFSTERIVLRRIYAIAAFDRELAAALSVRSERRRTGLRALSERLPARRSTLDPQDTLTLLCLHTSFAYFDALAGPEREITEVVPLAQQHVRSALSLPPRVA